VRVQVSSIELESACVKHIAAVIHAAAVAVPSPGGGPDSLFLFLVLSSTTGPSETELLRSCQAAIRQHLNPLFKVQRVLVRASLPRNASNKVMRRVLRAELESMMTRPSKL
jgi:acetyl-CoA synthetase